MQRDCRLIYLAEEKQIEAIGVEQNHAFGLSGNGLKWRARAPEVCWWADPRHVKSVILELHHAIEQLERRDLRAARNESRMAVRYVQDSHSFCSRKPSMLPQLRGGRLRCKGRSK